MILVLSQQNCQPCRATERHLDRLGVKYVKVDVVASPALQSVARALGHQQTPVVIADGEHWSGYRPARLDKLGEP